MTTMKTHSSSPTRRRRRPSVALVRRLHVGDGSDPLHHLRVELAYFNVWSWRLQLEDRFFTQADFELINGVWVLELRDFPVHHRLDAVLEASGQPGGGPKGGAIAAAIACDGRPCLPELAVETLKGHGVDPQHYVV